MIDEEMMRELRSLRSEVGSLGDQVLSVRYEDIKGSLMERVKAAMGEEGKRSFRHEATALRSSSSCQHKSECLTTLSEAVDLAADLFLDGDSEGAEKLMSELERKVTGERSPCTDGACSREAVETLRRVRTILSIYQGLADRLGYRSADLLPKEQVPEVPPEQAEAMLGPLANAWRIKVLRALRPSDRSLSDLGRAVELRTGHLQFHLRALIEAGYVKADRRRHLYSLTARGQAALQGAEALAFRLGPFPADR